MNRLIPFLAVAVLAAATAARGAFVEPTRDQLKAAAQHPPMVVALVQDANVEQAAQVARGVFIEIINLDLEDEERDQRLTDVVFHLYAAFPDSHKGLSSALGRMVAASPAASMSAEVVSAIQLGVIKATNTANGNTFGNAYTLAMQTVAGAPGGGKTVPPQPPPPPVALPYEAQRLL